MYCVKIVDRSGKNLAKFEYLGIKVTNQNCVHDGIKNRLNSGNVFYHPVNRLLFSLYLSKNIKFKIKIIFCFTFYFVWM